MMRPRIWLPLVVLTASLLARVTAASDFQEKRFNLVPFVGWTFFDKELKPPSGPFNDDLYLGGRLGLRVISPLWLDLAGGYTKTKACDCEPTWTHLSANLLLVSSKPRAFNPFISLGGGFSKIVPQFGADDKNATLEAAAGVKVKVTNTIGLRLEARDVLILPKGNYSKAHINNIVAGAGLVFAFGGKDDDGDSDGDGVRDGLDNCPDTPHGCKVDANGCPIDSDGDGVCDGLDRCPDTPRGATVDAKGCPTDSDGDGVWDGIDQCPDTPRGCIVDARGCPIDSDGDGVCDGLDKCPGTPSGARVDKDGCQFKDLEMELLDTGMIRLTNVNFDYDKSTIRSNDHAVLDSVGRVLTKWPGLNIRIDAHTDSRGTDAYNMALSHRRAASVRTYLLAHFPQFGPGQLTSKGFGETDPLVPNTSQANMQQNRRVEFVVLNKGILKGEK